MTNDERTALATHLQRLLSTEGLYVAVVQGLLASGTPAHLVGPRAFDAVTSCIDHLDARARAPAPPQDVKRPSGKGWISA